MQVWNENLILSKQALNFSLHIRKLTISGLKWHDKAESFPAVSATLDLCERGQKGVGKRQ